MRRDASLRKQRSLFVVFRSVRPCTRKGVFHRRGWVGENKDFLNILHICVGKRYLHSFPLKYMQLDSPDFTFQVLMIGICPLPRISTTKSTSPEIGSFSMCGWPASGTSI